jgi:hypothetical protein
VPSGIDPRYLYGLDPSEEAVPGQELWAPPCWKIKGKPLVSTQDVFGTLEYP